MSKYWGYHLILDCAACDKGKITDPANITAFAKELVKRIDMVAYGEPQVIRFGSGNKEGYTLVQLIETSNICAHFCNDSGDGYIDVFSCKPFVNADVVATVREFFSPTNINQSYLTRDATVKSAEVEQLFEPPSID
jgi:S-adenosylmethionine decarboxylase